MKRIQDMSVWEILAYIFLVASVILLMLPDRTKPVVILTGVCVVAGILSSMVFQIRDAERKRPLLLNLCFYICWLGSVIIPFLPNSSEQLQRLASFLAWIGLIVGLCGDRIVKSLGRSEE